MGVGDELMCSGEARALRRRDPRPVAVRDRYGALRWHALWDGVDGMARPEQVQAGLDCQFLVNGPGARPYIDYAETKQIAAAAGVKGERKAPRWAWKPYRPESGTVALTEQEKLRAALARPAGPFVAVEPNIKETTPNKAWGVERYQAVVDALPGVGFVQMGSGPNVLSRVHRVETPSFRDAVSLLALAAAYVGPEGGLHHAAAAVDVPAVVIFGGFISPDVTGYSGHVNLFAGEGLGCGNRNPCACCAEAMARITPERVAFELFEVLRQHGG